tara:strand:+ start:1238 stop:1822 length:585 start_codon:yes stop_codon:yes gene_type:complete
MPEEGLEDFLSPSYSAEELREAMANMARTATERELMSDRRARYREDVLNTLDRNYEAMRAGEPLEMLPLLEETIPDYDDPDPDDISDILDRVQFTEKAHDAARVALAPNQRDDEGAFVDKGESSHRETRRGNTIYASSEPRWDYEYDPEALRRAKRDTRQSEIDYNKELARKEAESIRRGRQDPNPTLGPSMTE